MTYHWIIPLLAALVTFGFGALVYRKAAAIRLKQVFAVLAFALVLWNLNFFVLYSVSDAELAFSLTRVFRMGSVLVPVAVLHLQLALLDRRSSIWRFVLAIDYAGTAILAIANLLDLVVSELRPVSFGYSSVTGPLYGGFTLSVIVNFAITFLLLAHDYRTTDDPRVKIQLKFWLLGSSVALPLGLTNLLPAYGVPIYPLGNLGNVVWVGVVAYAMVRHRLMDVDLVVSKGVAYFATSLLVITPAFAISIIMQDRIFGSVHYDFSFALLVMFVAIGVLFPTLRLRTEATVERTFFSAKQEYRLVLASFAKSIIRILDGERLLLEVANKLVDTLRVDRLAIFVRQGVDGPLRLRHSVGIGPIHDEYSADDVLITCLNAASEAVLREEAEARDDPDWKKMAEVLLANGWEVCLPLAASGSVIGFIGLGRKRNLDIYSIVDLDLLNTIAAQSAIALENARLYEELHKSRNLIQRADRMSALGTLAAGIAHEIRNPLVSIQTFFQLAPSRLQDQEFFTSFLGLAENEVKRIADLVTELLTFARSHPEAIQEVDIDDAIDRTIRLLSPQAHKHRVQLYRVGSSQLPLIRVDPDKIKQVLINIILNGIQATPESGTVTVSTGIVLHRELPFCQIAIRDTGPGIQAPSHEDIFNPFFTTKDKGTGLGLSIAHQIISDHGGFISVESHEGAGCVFFIHLPVSSRTSGLDTVAPSAMAG